MLEVAQTECIQTRERGRCTDGYLSTRKCPTLQLDGDTEHSCADFLVPMVPWGAFCKEGMVSQATPDPIRDSFLPGPSVGPVCVCVCVCVYMCERDQADVMLIICVGALKELMGKANCPEF